MKRYLLIIIVMFLSIQYAKSNDVEFAEPNKIIVYVCDIARGSGAFTIEMTDKSVKYSFKYLFLSDKDNNKFEWVVRQVTDMDSCTQKYLRESIYDFFVLKKKKYKYYKKVKYPEDNCPGGPYIKIRYLFPNGKSDMEIFQLTDNVESEKPLCNGGEIIIYDKEYSIFLKTMLDLTYKYSDSFIGERIVSSHGYWYWP
mgnify:CR=1 FL=1